MRHILLNRHKNHQGHPLDVFRTRVRNQAQVKNTPTWMTSSEVGIGHDDSFNRDSAISSVTIVYLHGPAGRGGGGGRRSVSVTDLK